MISEPSSSLPCPLANTATKEAKKKISSNDYEITLLMVHPVLAKCIIKKMFWVNTGNN